MPVYETFSKRQKRLEQAGQLDVYQYDLLPETFRIQVIHIWESALGSFEPGYNERVAASEAWEYIHHILSRERGVLSLDDPHDNPDTQCKSFLRKANIDGVLDIIELSFRVIDGDYLRNMSEYDKYKSKIIQNSDDAIAELNHRFHEHSIGYEYVGDNLIKQNSQYIHAEVVKPALSLLQDQHFSGPEEEFLHAHQHYRKGEYKEAIVDALKAFESTMKAICDARKWPYDKSKTAAKELIDIVFQQGLVPAYMQSHFAALRTTLQTGLSTIRNKTSGHGQGAIPVVIPEHFAAYALHLAAANIVFLVEAHEALK